MEKNINIKNYFNHENIDILEKVRRYNGISYEDWEDEGLWTEEEKENLRIEFIAKKRNDIEYNIHKDLETLTKYYKHDYGGKFESYATIDDGEDRIQVRLMKNHQQIKTGGFRQDMGRTGRSNIDLYYERDSGLIIFKEYETIPNQFKYVVDYLKQYNGFYIDDYK